MVTAATPASACIRARLLVCSRVSEIRIPNLQSLSSLPPLVPPRRQLLFSRPNSSPLSATKWRKFCSGIVASADADVLGRVLEESGQAIRKFKRRLRIADILGGPEEGEEWIGKELSVRGWVRTCRIQSNVTFIEVNDGSCVSNMQCVMSPDAEGYDQVEGGSITTGASVTIEGIVVSSLGSKQKVELRVARLILVFLSFHSDQRTENEVSNQARYIIVLGLLKACSRKSSIEFVRDGRDSSNDEFPNIHCKGVPEE